MAGVTVDPLLVGDAPAAGGLLAASHGEYPAFRRRLPDPAVRARVLRPFMAVSARDAARYGRRFARVAPVLEQGLPDGRVWYLQAMGIHPSAQRQGIGSALMVACRRRRADLLRYDPPTSATGR